MTETRVLRITGEALKGTKRSTRKGPLPFAGQPEAAGKGRGLAAVGGQKGGYDDAPGSRIPTASVTPINLMRGGSSRREEAPPNLIAVESKPAPAAVAPAAPQLVKGGGKLDLAPKKEKLALVKGKRSHTRKVVKIQMGNLRKSMRRAKDITTDSKEKKIEEIEEILVKAGIIRKRDGPMSEGKQKTIRDIYRDYLQLRLNAL
jgi:hypothetical protein